MEILLQLGANETAFIQFIIFVVAISFLTVVVYNPYFKAYDQRLKLTKGADQVANETQDEAQKLTQIYQTKAREINAKINHVFETSRIDALKSCAIIAEAAKNSVQTKAEAAAKNIETQKANASSQLKVIAQDVSNEIVKKLMGAV